MPEFAPVSGGRLICFSSTDIIDKVIYQVFQFHPLPHNKNWRTIFGWNKSGLHNNSGINIDKLPLGHISHDECHTYPLEKTNQNRTIEPMKRRFLLAIFLSLCMLLALLMDPPHQVHGQEPTLEPTPTTPAYVQETTLTSGVVFRVERVITYGDAAVTIMLFVYWITFVLAKAIEIPKRFIR